MGSISSVSLPAISTCRPCDCWRKCYAHKIERLRPTVKNAYQNNFEILRSDSALYWKEVEDAIKLSRFFRFHVSGDIPTRAYFYTMIQIACRNPHCDILCFTKRYSFINLYLDSGCTIPQNLHIVFSAWPGLRMDNPYNLPEAHVRFKNGTTTAGEHAKECSGNCTTCAKTDTGCWTLQNGEQVVFNEH